MAEAQVNYEDDFTVEDETLLSRLEEKNRAGTTSKDAYDALSFLPVTGEAIAAYELPGILSQSGKMMQSKDFLEAAAGTGLATLGVASVLPGIGPVARYAKKGIEGFIPYLGPKTATAGGPDIDTSITKIIASEEATGGSEKIAKHIELSSSKKKKQDIFKENKTFVDPLDNKISFEIDTKNANLLESAVKETDRGFFGSHFLKRNPNSEYGLYKLDELLTGMEDLFKQYPDLKDAYVQPFNGVVEHNGKLVQAGGAVDFQDFVIKLGPGTSQKNLTEKLLHETQHLVDFLEGRQPGGSPLMFSGTAKQNMKNYKKLSGEVRARLVQDRFFYNLQDEFPKPDTSPKKVLNTEDDIMEVGGQSFEGAKEITKDLNLGSGSLFSPKVKKGRKLLIVSCSADKCPDPGDMEAFDRYTGDMYKSMKKIGVPEENVDLAIMSAKYGLIRRDTPIPTYNVKMDKEIAGNLLKDPAQVDRIRNTITGYDEVVVEGSDLYKGVVKEAAGDIPLRDFKIDFKKAVELGEVKPDGGYGSGRQKQSVGNFLRSNKPVDVYHYTQADVPPNIFDFKKANPYDPISNLGLHVGTTSKAARDRFVALNTSSPVRSLYKKGMPFEEALVKGKDYPQAGPPMNPLLKSMVGKETKSSYGSSMPLKANVNKPFLNPKTGDPFSETELFRYLEDKAAKTGTNNTEAAISLRKELANQDYTHIPYVNDFEDKNTLSLIMLIDRPKDSAAVLKGKFGKNDPTQRTNPDIMKEDGGVVSLKDKAVNMTRGPRGIEPYIQYMKNGGEPKYEQGQDLGDVEMRADLEPYLYGNPLARLGYELYKEGKIDIQGVVSESGGGSQRSYGLFSKDRGEIGYIADQREDSPDPLRILTHELAHAAMDFIEGKDQAGREGFNKYGNVDYEESMVRGGDVLIDQRSPSGEKLAQNYFGRLKPTTQDMRKFMNVSKVAQEALDKKGLPPEVIAEGDTGFSGTSGNRLLSNTDKLKRFFIGKFMNPERNVNNYLNLTGEDIRKAEGGVIGLKDRAVKMHRNVV